MPLEKSQERPSLSENTERLSRPGLRLTDELELRFLENLRHLYSNKAKMPSVVSIALSVLKTSLYSLYIFYLGRKQNHQFHIEI